MSRSEEVYHEVRQDLEQKGLLGTLDPASEGILAHTWRQVMGDYLDTKHAQQIDAWSSNRALKPFVLKWARHLAGQIQQLSATPDAAIVDKACKTAIEHARKECDRVLAAGTPAVDPGFYKECRPFCTSFLSH